MFSTHRSPAGAARAARQSLSRLARPANTFDASRYFRGEHDLVFLNVGTPQVRALAREVVAAHPDWSVDDAMAFAAALMPDRALEAKGVAVEVVARFRRSFRPGLLGAWRRWLVAGHAANWATTDAICGSLIGPLLRQHPELVARTRGWVRSRSLWLRRAAAVALVPSARHGVQLPAAYEVARALHGDPADLIQKAVGWLLREAGRTDPDRLERYLRANGPHIPRTTLRYAIERFPAARRRSLLADTRRGGRGVV